MRAYLFLLESRDTGEFQGILVIFATVPYEIYLRLATDQAARRVDFPLHPNEHDRLRTDLEALIPLRQLFMFIELFMAIFDRSPHSSPQRSGGIRLTATPQPVGPSPLLRSTLTGRFLELERQAEPARRGVLDDDNDDR